MKKFLIFLFSIVVVVCLGLTTYYFMRNNEIITVKTKEIYCNAGDSIPLASLGINIEKANVSKKTTFDYNAGGDEVTKYIKYDEASASYIVSQENAGEVTLVIRTSNKKYADFTINVHIGNGTKENPYYIFNESELMRIGSTYRLDSHYRLMNDITLTSNFKPLGYNANTEEWGTFNGTFDGQGYSIKGLSVNNIETDNIGLFGTLGANAVVKNLTIANATISGSYANAGILAGVSNGQIEKVVVKNSTLTNTKSNSVNGAFVGSLNGDVKLSYAESVTINLNGEEGNPLENVIAGGFVGKLNQSIIQASYANNVELKIANANAKAGGFVGEFVIGTETGSIQQSYANTISSYANYGAFVGKVTKSASFDEEKANKLRYFIGNMAIVYGVPSQNSITDAHLVKDSLTEFFKNETYVDRSGFYERESALYLIRGFASATELISTNEFVYYAIDMNNLTNWDTTYVWNVQNNALPTLRMGSIYPADPSGEYFRRNLAEKSMGNKETFVSTFSSDVSDQNIKLLSDVDVTNGWTPVAVANTTFDGNNKTIKINLNNAKDNQLGLFTTIDNSTIKNLNIVVVGVSANATNAGALAGSIISSDEMTVSSIENVTITYQGFETPIISNFGGVAGTIDKTNIINTTVTGLTINEASSISNAGAIAGTIEAKGQVTSSSINSIIYANSNAGAIAGINNGTITKVTGHAIVNSNSTQEVSYIGGVVGNNAGSLDNIVLTTDVNIKNSGTKSYVGGVAGYNSGKITNINVTGTAVRIETASMAKIYVGGVVSHNNGSVENVVSTIANVGTYQVGKNHVVGGVVAQNNGTISKVVVQSNLAGNYVSGVVAEMNNSTAKIDQVVIGKFDAASRKLNKNQIIGDKYIAGIVVDFRAGTITNVQAASEIVGQTNSTRSSLVALIFTYGSNLKNSTIDSSIGGYGVKYRETWVDFASYQNKAEFGLPASEAYDGRFNIYLQDVHHGCMQSVVINIGNAGALSTVSAMGGAFAFDKDYQDTADSSFVKTVYGFSSVEQFQGSFELKVGESSWFGIDHNVTKTLSFAIGSIWKSNSGISLMFVDSLIPNA